MDNKIDKFDTLRVIVYFTKGLGPLVLRELDLVLPAVHLLQAEDRFYILEIPNLELAIIRDNVRTIDDVRILVSGPERISTSEQFARVCVDASETTHAYLASRDTSRVASSPWSITLSARKPVWRRDAVWDPKEVIRRNIGEAEPDSQTRQLVDLRFQVDGDQTHVSLSVGEPLGGVQRSDNNGAGLRRPGALRTSVAAALVRLAVESAEPSVLRCGIYDPFCGTGTIVAEAARLQIPVYASDIDDQAVALTRDRLSNPADRQGKGIPEVDLQHRIFPHDVHFPMPKRVNARIVVSNLPWGKQIIIPRRSELFDAVGRLVSYAIDRDGVAVLLTTREEQLVARIRRQATNSTRIETVRIGLLGQTPAIVTVRNG